MGASLVKKVIIGGVAFIVIGLTLAFGPSMLSGFEATRNDVESYTQTETDVTRAADNTSAITLARPLIAASTGFITSVSSNLTETPVVSSVTTTSANFSGMDGGANRTLTVTYDYGTAQYYTGLTTTVQMGPTFVLLGFIFTVGIVAFMGIRMKMK